jgi:hypothetical protein
LLWRKFFEDEHCPSPGLYAAAFPELSLISYVKPIEKYLAFEPWSGSKYRLHSQGKLTTPRRENRKIRHENVILKANERLQEV